MAKKRFRLPLIGKIFLGIALGILLGHVTPLWFVRIFATYNSLFSQLLKFVVPLIILGLVAPAIFEVGMRAGKMLLFTIALAYGSSCLLGFLSLGVSVWVWPALLTPGSIDFAGETGVKILPFFEIEIPPLFDVMSALSLSFVLGLGLAYFEGHTTLRKGLQEFRDIVELTIKKVLVPLLPIYVFGLFLSMTYSDEVGPVIHSAASLFGVIFLMAMVVIVLYFLVSGAITGTNPLKSLWIMLPVYFTALSTSSSAATIPVTLRQTKLLGVNEDVADFTVPLCSTIHMPGLVTKMVALSAALIYLSGHPINVPCFIQFVFLLGITAVAAPGVPGGGIMAAVGILQSVLGMDEATLAMMITLYFAMDSFGTACNVTCDGALAQIVDRYVSEK